MKFQGRSQLWVVLGLIMGMLTLLLSVESSVAQNQVDTTSSTTTDIYLPLTLHNYPWVTTFGAQVNNFADPNIANLAEESGLNWVRIDAFDWSKIEPQNTNSSGYHWDVVDEASLMAASENGINVIAIIRNTPDWAQKKPPYKCGPVSEGALPEFANFVRDVVKRYSAAPYNIKYWELGNEPDVDPSLVSPNSVFGCWGDINDRYYGGGYYAEMLKVAYPAIKAADPMAKVLLGGLLLDCDPTKTTSCKAGKFLEGVLRNGGGNYFDIISFHGYPPYLGPSSGFRSLHLDDNFPTWKHRGGVVLGKLDFLKQVIAQFGFDKPIFHTEGALICPENNSNDCNPPDNAFYEAQADYVVWLYVRNWANGVKATIWYTFNGPGWRYGGLLNEVQSPKPAYNALKFLTQELGAATYKGRVLESTPVDGYKFADGTKLIWVLWSPDQVSHMVSLPGNATKAFDKFGIEIPLSGNQLNVNSPVYVEFSQ
jgi:hypothetical protein